MQPCDNSNLCLSILSSHLEAARLLEGQVDVITSIAATVFEAITRRQRLFLCGNGGSAADAQHIAAELVGRFKAERRALPAIALTTDTSILTAVANDYDFDSVFARQIEALALPGDALLAISTSGNSRNVIEAVKAAKEMGVLTIGLTGGNGGVLKTLCDQVFVAPSSNTARIQEMHILVGHMVCEVIDARLAGAVP